MTLLTGIFADGAIVGFAASRVHWPDVGGIAPGSSAVTDEIIKEGLRLPPVKIVKAGVVDEELWSVLFANVRVPQDRIGDFKAQIAGNNRGVERVEGLAQRYGAATLQSILSATQSYSQQLIEATIGSLEADHEFKTNGPASYYRLPHRDQHIGFIGAMTRPKPSCCERAVNCDGLG